MKQTIDNVKGKFLPWNKVVKTRIVEREAPVTQRERADTQLNFNSKRSSMDKEKFNLLYNLVIEAEQSRLPSQSCNKVDFSLPTKSNQTSTQIFSLTDPK